MARRWQWRVRRTTGITVALLAFVVGVGCAHTGWPLPLSELGLCLIFLFGLHRRRPWLLVGLCCCLTFGLGWWRGSLTHQALEPYRQLFKHKVVLTATALDDAVYADGSQLSFSVSGVHLEKPFIAAPPGTLAVKGFGELMVYKGDQVQIEGTLQPTLGAKQGRLSYAEITVIGRQTTWLDNFKRRFTAGLSSALPEPAASFGLGLLIGQRTTLPKTVSDQLTAVGLTHIVAVSGYNLTIIIDAARKILGKRSKFQTTCLSLLLIVGFLLITGLSASIVRAALVSSLSLGIWYWGRTIKPLLLIALAAAITAGWNPLYVWSDTGWYLSFLAFFGVLMVAPVVSARLFRPPRQPGLIASVLLESGSAQVMTAPFILMLFHQTSSVALVSNAVLVPLVPLAMLATAVAGLAGMLVPGLSGWLAWPGRLILTYLLDMVSLFARLPHALVERSLSLPAMLAIYLVLTLVLLVMKQRRRPKGAIITDTKGQLEYKHVRTQQVVNN